jgi:MATE family multidrug resistance protein
LRERGAAPEPLSHARVLKIALPIVVSNATVPLLGIVDTAVVGQLGDPVPIGAVGLGAIILSSVYWVFGFLRMGTVGLAAQALGARDGAEVAALLTRVLMIGVGAGLAMILLQGPILAGALWLSPASAEVEALVRSYMTIRVFSAPAAIAMYGITGWLIAQERTGAVLALQLVQNGLNIALSVVLVCWASISAWRAWPGPRSSRNGRGWRWAFGSAVGPSAWRPGATGRGCSTGRSSGGWRR